MKTLFNTTTNESANINGLFNFIHSLDNSEKEENYLINYNWVTETKPEITRSNLLTPEARLKVMNGEIPDLWEVCRDLYETFFVNEAPCSAKQFIPILERTDIGHEQLKKFLKNGETRHILVNNSLMKVVLIHWKPGKVSNIHGHPSGGCTFKILQGKVEELRYSTNSPQRIIASNGYKSGDIAYIDDTIGHHAVGNIFGTSAVSLHVYTPGN